MDVAHCESTSFGGLNMDRYSMLSDFKQPLKVFGDYLIFVLAVVLLLCSFFGKLVTQLRGQVVCQFCNLIACLLITWLMVCELMS